MHISPVYHTSYIRLIIGCWTCVALILHTQQSLAQRGGDSIVSSRQKSADYSLKKFLEKQEQQSLEDDIQKMLSALLLICDMPDIDNLGEGDEPTSGEDEQNALNRNRRRREDERRRRERQRPRRTRKSEARRTRIRYRRISNEDDNPNEIT